MFWCWIKAVLLSVSVVGTVIGGIVAFIALILGIVWLGDKISDAVRYHAPKAADIGWGAAKVIAIILVAAAIFGGIYAAKEQVCMVGFKKAYVDVFKSIAPDSKK